MRKSCVCEKVVKELCMSVKELCVKKLRVKRVVCGRVACEKVVCEKASVLLPTLGQSRPPKRRG
jgi:hypothetical protein